MTDWISWKIVQVIIPSLPRNHIISDLDGIHQMQNDLRTPLMVRAFITKGVFARMKITLVV